jgi:nucleoside-diphosphate-sugar epimerase
MRNNEKVVFFGGHDPKRNFIHINDLVKIIYKTVEDKIEGEYDCAYPVNISFSEIAEAARVVFKSKSEVVFDSSFENISDIGINFETSLYPKINFYPEISLNVGIQMLADLDSMKKND